MVDLIFIEHQSQIHIEIVATFYRNRGLKGVKFTREELQAYWYAKSKVRSIEYQKMMDENDWSKADLARYLGVSRAWVTVVMRELG